MTQTYVENNPVSVLSGMRLINLQNDEEKQNNELYFHMY